MNEVTVVPSWIIVVENPGRLVVTTEVTVVPGPVTVGPGAVIVGPDAVIVGPGAVTVGPGAVTVGPEIVKLCVTRETEMLSEVETVV